MLQEVGSATALNELNERLKRPFSFAEVLPGNSDRDIHLAILSQSPFQLTSHREQTLSDESGQPLYEFDSEVAADNDAASVLKLQRDLMLAEVGPGGDPPLAVFNVHLKSKTNREWRLLGADVVRSARVSDDCQSDFGVHRKPSRSGGISDRRLQRHTPQRSVGPFVCHTSDRSDGRGVGRKRWQSFHLLATTTHAPRFHSGFTGRCTTTGPGQWPHSQIPAGAQGIRSLSVIAGSGSASLTSLGGQHLGFFKRIQLGVGQAKHSGQSGAPVVRAPGVWRHFWARHPGH